jgi:hypothetical protein
MRTKLLLVLVLLSSLAGAAWVRSGACPVDLLTPERLMALLERPLDVAPTAAKEPTGATEPRTFWDALLALPAAVRDGDVVTLTLGRVLADPSVARLAAEQAGELLDLPAEGPDGVLGGTLLDAVLHSAVLHGPATTSGADGRTLSVYGCRHNADDDAGPLIEDTYAARQSLVRALRAGAEAAGEPLTVCGENAPVKGGVNFDVQQRGEEQRIVVTFDGSRASFSAHRSFRPRAPNDAHARASLVSALESLARTRGVKLHIEGREERAPHGVDVRIERYGTRLAVTATNAGERLAAHVALDG